MLKYIIAEIHFAKLPPKNCIDLVQFLSSTQNKHSVLNEKVCLKTLFERLQNL